MGTKWVQSSLSLATTDYSWRRVSLMSRRAVITTTETLHRLTSGFIYSPFDKRLHAAGCDSTRLMRASVEPEMAFRAARGRRDLPRRSPRQMARERVAVSCLLSQGCSCGPSARRTTPVAHTDNGDARRGR